jgi:FAD:protein FMN transferase
VTVGAAHRLVDARDVWGTVIRIEVRDPLGAGALDDAWHWFERVDDLFSTWRADSEVSRLARGELDPARVSPEVTEVLTLCDDLRLASTGAFDVAFAAATGVAEVPGRCAIDPTGVVKGWAVDRAVELIEARGATDFAVNAGGDVVVRGFPERGDVWRIGIQHPWERRRLASTIGVTGLAVATSGGYERGEHVVDARTGQAACGLASVTVVASDLATADGCATAALALGRDGMAWLAQRGDVVAMGITDERRVVKTAGFDRLVTG